MTDPARTRIAEVARWLRVQAYGRSTHPASTLHAAAARLLEPLENARPDPLCKCGNPLPAYRGRGARRKLCESCRPPRLNQYRANIGTPEKVEA